MHPALATLLGSAPLLGDGGTGTSLIERGVAPEACLEQLNLSRPDLVADLHRAFAEAGAQLVETNTFGANRFKLAAYGLADRVAELNRAGVDLARPAGVAVAGSVGPLGVHLAPYGRVRRAQAFAAFSEQITSLTEAGVDLLVLETQSDLGEVEQALGAARAAGDLPVLVTATFTTDDRTLLGSSPAQVAQRLVALGADAVGVNCSQGPTQVLRIVRAMRAAAESTPIVARPNAGGPTRIGGRIMYPATPEYFGRQARALVAAGAAVVGGCCGTGPAHIRAMAQALRQPPTPERVKEAAPVAPEITAEPAPEPTALDTKLAAGRFVITVEMDPPRGFSVARLLAGAETLADAGADMVDVADSPMARMRMSPWAACRLIQERVGLETVLHFPTRGRNILRIQGDLLAAHALGIRNLFICLGDPTAIGDYPSATSNVDVAPTGLLALVTQGFNQGRDQAGSSIGEATRFVAGCALNLRPPDLERECRLLRRKIEAGADFALTQPVYEADAVERFRLAYERRHGELCLPLLVGVLPLVSARHAEFLHQEVPGIDVPATVRERLHRAGADAAAEGTRIVSDIAQQLRGRTAGLYLMPPFNRYDIAAEIVEAVRGD